MTRPSPYAFLLVALPLVIGCGSEMSLYEAVQQDDAEAVRRIAKSHPSSLDSFTVFGSSPLLYAFEQGSKNAYLALLENGADPNRIGPRGANLMTYVAANPDVFWLRHALKHGGNPNLDNMASPERRCIPVIASASDDCIECLKLLIEDYNADIHYIVTGDDALVHAAASNDFVAVLFLLQSGADFRRKTGQYRSFANTIMQKKVSDFLLEKDQKGFQAVIDWLRSQGVEWDKPVRDGEIWSYSNMP
jgi:ankyrin repeat protein